MISGSDDFMGESLGNACIPAKFRKVDRSFIRLGKHAILGTNTIVHPGVTVGEGSVVGAGATVVRDLEPWGVYLGAPARRIKARPSETILRMEGEMVAEFGY